MTEQYPQFSRTQKTVPRMHSIAQGHLQQPKSEDEADMRGGEPQHSPRKREGGPRGEGNKEGCNAQDIGYAHVAMVKMHDLCTVTF